MIIKLYINSNFKRNFMEILSYVYHLKPYIFRFFSYKCNGAFKLLILVRLYFYTFDIKSSGSLLFTGISITRKSPKNKHWHMSIIFKLKSKVFLLWNKANKSFLNFIQIRFGFYAIRRKLNYIVLWYVKSWSRCFLITSHNSLTNLRKQYHNTCFE